MSGNNIAGNRNSTPEASNTLRPPSSRQIGSGHHLRASADMAAYSSASLTGRGIRPASEVYFGQASAGQGQGNIDDMDKATQQWLADIDQYEATLEEMATATLDQDFKDELSAIEQWFRVLSEAERTSALYALLQQTTQVQIRFFIQVLQEMAKNHPMSGILSPANFGQKGLSFHVHATLLTLTLSRSHVPEVERCHGQTQHRGFSQLHWPRPPSSIPWQQAPIWSRPVNHQLHVSRRCCCHCEAKRTVYTADWHGSTLQP
jgi:hypothetical protein